MDRDKRWERVKIGYDLLVNQIGEKFSEAIDAVRTSYQAGVTDEFIKPIVIIDEKGEPVHKLNEGDVFICFNFRTDRLREITIALTQKDFPEYDIIDYQIYLDNDSWRLPNYFELFLIIIRCKITKC